MPQKTITQEQSEAVLRALPDPAFVLTESGRYAAVYGGSDTRYYHDGSPLVGKTLHEVLPREAADEFLQQIRKALATRQMVVHEYELSVNDVDGISVDGPREPIWFLGRISALLNGFLGEPAVVWVASNITESKHLERLLKEQALTDDLTGVHNRRRFMQQMVFFFDVFKRYTTPCSVITFDIDRFKEINDNLGHPIGDQALKALSASIKPLLRESDMLFRLGGDEFAIICPNTGLEETLNAADRIRLVALDVLAPFASENRNPALSLGVSSLHEGDSSYEGVLNRCDQGLYQAKESGGNRTCSAL